MIQYKLLIITLIFILGVVIGTISTIVYLNNQSQKPLITSPSGLQIADSQSREIVFIRDGDIHICTADGRSIQRLTTDGHSAYPIWSTNGQLIAFTRSEPPKNRSGIWESSLQVIHSDGSTAVTLKTVQGMDLVPVAWLPWDTGIIYNCIELETEGLPGSFAAVDLDGNAIHAPLDKWNKAAVTKHESLTGFGGTLAFSSSFEEAVLTGYDWNDENDSPSPRLKLYRIGYDGSNLQEISTSEQLWITCLRWQPGGEKILCAGTHDLSGDIAKCGIWLINPQTGDFEKLVSGTAPSRSGIDWSPSCDRVIYQMIDKGHPAFEHPDRFDQLSSGSSIWIMNADGTDKRRILDNACHPNWRRP